MIASDITEEHPAEKSLETGKIPDDLKQKWNKPYPDRLMYVIIFISLPK